MCYRWLICRTDGLNEYTIGASHAEVLKCTCGYAHMSRRWGGGGAREAMPFFHIFSRTGISTDGGLGMQGTSTGTASCSVLCSSIIYTIGGVSSHEY